MNSERTSFDWFEVKPSSIHGLGVFAKRDIPKGTAWWEGTLNANILILNQLQYQFLDRSENTSFKTDLWNLLASYAYYSSKLDALILCLDNARYLNHSFQPNSGADKDADPLKSVALRDIQKGEEIVENYELYDQCSWTQGMSFQATYENTEMNGNQ